MPATTPLSSRVPLVYEEVKRELRGRLASQWRTGKRLPPIKRLAAELGAGQSNTHRAVKELAAEGLLASRPGRGTFVCAPPKAAPPRRQTNVRQIVLVRSSASELMIDRIADGFRDGLPGDLRDKVTLAYLKHKVISEWPDADAVVVINPNSVGDFDIKPHQTFVAIDTAITGGVSKTKRLDIVSTDSAQGSQLAGQWMRDVGCDDIFFVGCTDKLVHQSGQTSSVRLRGFEAGYGKTIADKHRLLVEAYMSDHGAMAAAHYMAMRNRPPGVFCASDDLAMGFMHGALGHGMRPGIDYQLVGFDGQTRGQEISCGPLTTVAAPVTLMGRTGAELLRTRLKNPDQPTRRVLLGCSFIKGATARRIEN